MNAVVKYKLQSLFQLVLGLDLDLQGNEWDSNKNIGVVIIMNVFYQSRRTL